ncbi:MAG: hypothetical protein IIW08_02355, partial [Clostridia bacterium]|nr:hypothetical protein [Clostridia bacterium]
PVYPRYVSSVDLGNLMAAMAAARNFLSEDEALFKEYQMLIDRMNIAFLYNDRKKLFRIGYDAENNRLSASHYDLFASEARILSYVSMAEKGIEIKHWKRLGRPFSMIGKKPVLLSWSGTMFEYMMPGLILPSTYKSLIRNTEKNITEIQKRRGKNGVWGISESGYCAFDRDLNYQYQAFGISDLALSGAQNGKVFSPYSVILSLEHSKESAIACLEKLTEMGLKGEYGFYEAVDMTQADSPKIVYSYMTHHQGMSFISLVNYLTGNKIKKLFMLDPKESSLLPLLSEKPFTTPLVKMLFEKRNKSILMDMENENLTPPGDFTRYARKSVNEGHILFCGDALLYFEQNGRSFYRKNGIYANRFSADASRKRDSILPVISDSSGTACLEKCLFDTGYVTCELSTGLIAAKVTLTLNPENGHMLIKGEIKSKKQEKVKVTVEHAFALCLTDEENMYAHPVFSDLFIRDENIDSIGKRYFRKDRNTLREDIQLIHMTDDNAVTPKSNERTHTKCAVLKRDITAQPNRKQELYIETGIVSKAMAHANEPDKSRFDKAVIMLRAQMNAHIEFCGLKASEYRNTDRSTVRLFSLSAKNGKEKLIPECLWPLGLSGDSPVIMAQVVQKSSVQALRKLLRAQEFFRYAGITLPIVVLHVKEADYFTPLSDEIRLILASANLTPGRDAFVFSEDELTEEQKMTVRALSVISVKHDFLKDTALEKKAHEEKASENKRLPSKHTENADLFEDNGYGGFLPDQIGYRIRVSESCFPPRRWSNFLANPDFGVMTNDLGISHVYYENSRMGRITPFSNNLDLPGTAIE